MNMRNLFPGYYQPTENEFKEIWQECIFAFDANILLNIYRYTPNTLNRFFDIFSKLKDRIWIPHQAAFEYQKGRYNVLSQQSKAYDEIEKILSTNFTQLQNSLTKYTKHPFINISEIKNVFEEAFEQANKKSENILNIAKSQHDSVNFDELSDKLDEILGENIGNKYAEDKLEAICKQAQQRFDAKIPPGYMDDKNKKEPEKYGDFIIWQQLIDYASSQKKPLIFVTDDDKEDWWSKHEGKKDSPRRELVEEMHSMAGVIFYIYSSDRFMSSAENFLNLPHEQEVIDEAINVRVQNNEEQLVQEQTKQLERNTTRNPDEELALQATRINSDMIEKALQGTRLGPSIIETALQGTRLGPSIIETALQATRINSDMIEKALQGTRFDPSIIEIELQATRMNLDIIEKALQATRFDSSIVEKALQETRFYPYSYTDALRCASARIQNIFPNNNP